MLAVRRLGLSHASAGPEGPAYGLGQPAGLGQAEDHSPRRERSPPVGAAMGAISATATPTAHRRYSGSHKVGDRQAPACPRGKTSPVGAAMAAISATATPEARHRYSGSHKVVNRRAPACPRVTPPLWEAPRTRASAQALGLKAQPTDLSGLRVEDEVPCGSRYSGDRRTARPNPLAVAATLPRTPARSAARRSAAGRPRCRAGRRRWTRRTG